MGLDFAIDELYSTGWTALDSTGCLHHGGRAYPSPDRARREFTLAGFELDLGEVHLFSCHRARWKDGTGQIIGSVVGQTEAEACVFALAQMRRSHATAALATP